MKFRKWDYALAGCLLGLALFSGCSNDGNRESLDTVKEAKTAKVAELERTTQSSSEISALLKDVLRVSIITPDGTEIHIANAPFLDELNREFAGMIRSEQAISNFAYTVVLYTKSDEPVVMQVGEEGVRVRETFYQGEAVPAVVDLVKNAVGSYYFANMQIDRIMISAQDLDRSTQLEGKLVNKFSDTLKTAQYIKEKPRLKDPLFPFYIMEMDIGGKQIVEARILSPTLLSVDSGGVDLFFQLKDSIFGLLKQEIPLIDYSDWHIKSLFNANQVSLVDHDGILPQQKTDLVNAASDPLETKGITHFFARLLSQGEPDNTGLDFSQKSPSLELQFFVDHKKVGVEVYSDGFIYRNVPYKKPGILRDIMARMEEDF